MKEHTTYHRVLRVATVVMAIALVFESGIIDDSTEYLTHNAHSYLANSIGMSASVQPTELNQLTAELTQKQRELEDREAALREREISVEISSDTASSDTATYVLASILFILLVLILLNYVLDYLRAKERDELQTV